MNMKIQVLYGTETGNAEMVAEDLKTAQRHALLKTHGYDLPVSSEG